MTSSTENLDDWAKANILVDNLAKAYWNHLSAQSYEPSPQRFGDEGWALYIHGKKAGKFDKQRLYKSIFVKSVTKYWAKKAKRHREAMRDVDWDICGKAFKKLSISK
jgi:hypothetical protein